MCCVFKNTAIKTFCFKLPFIDIILAYLEPKFIDSNFFSCIESLYRLSRENKYNEMCINFIHNANHHIMRNIDLIVHTVEDNCIGTVFQFTIQSMKRFSSYA